MREYLLSKSNLRDWKLAYEMGKYFLFNNNFYESFKIKFYARQFIQLF